MKSIFIISSIAIFSLASCQRMSKTNDISYNSTNADIVPPTSLVYDYPIKPGSLAWKELQSNEEKVRVCQIPENILSKLSTKELLDVCLAYPLLQDIYAFNNLENGINKLFNDFNGIRELSKRQDVVEKFIDEYKNRISAITGDNESYTEFAKGKFAVGISTIEALSTREEILKMSDIKSQNQLMNSLLNGYELKKLNPAQFKGVGFKTNLLSRAYLIAFKNRIPIDDNIKQLNFNEQSIEKIDKQSKSF